MGFHTSYLYNKVDSELYRTSGYNGGDADVDNTERFTSDIDLTVSSGAVIDITFDGSNDMDDLLLCIYRRRDENWQGVERMIEASITVSNDGTEGVFSLAIGRLHYGPGHYRVGMKSSDNNTIFDIYATARFYRDTRSIA